MLSSLLFLLLVASDLESTEFLFLGESCFWGVDGMFSRVTVVPLSSCSWGRSKAASIMPVMNTVAPMMWESEVSKYNFLSGIMS